MKIKKPTHQLKRTLMAGIIVLPLLAFNTAEAQFLNPSFEDGLTQPQQNSLFRQHLPLEWEYYNPNFVPQNEDDPVELGPGQSTGTLLISHWFNDTTSDNSSRGLLLYTNYMSAGNGEYGVEQTMEDPAQGGTIYYLTADVGNPHSGTANGTYFNLDGFPGYRIEVRVGEHLIETHWDQLEIEEGQIETATLQFRIYEGSAHEGEPISIRLINENNILNFDSQENHVEVDFDNITVTTGPIPTGDVTPVAPGPQIFRALNPDAKDDELELNFTISGKGKKRVLLTGLGQSLHERRKDVATDPMLIIEKSNRVFARSDNWFFEDDAKEIASISKQLGMKTFPTDAGIILELEPGNYSAKLSAHGEKGVHAALRIFDLDPRSKTAFLSYGDDDTKELKRLLSPTSSKRKK